MSSWNDVTKKVREIRKNFVVRCAISFVAVLASALLQSYVILAFIRPAGLLSSGFTGLAILIDRIAELYGFTVSTSLALVVLNLPVALMCCRSINVKFTVFSLLQETHPQVVPTLLPSMFPIRPESPFGTMCSWEMCVSL